MIKAIKTRFQGKKEVPPDSVMMLNFTHMTVFASTRTDNILNETQREFHLPSIRGMKRIASLPAYIELLNCLVRAMVGKKVYVKNRMTKPLSEWFTRTDEAFLLLCLESYVGKWNQEWMRANLVLAAPPQPPQQQEGEQKQGEDCKEALYTGRSQGTKCSWSNEGLEHFNALMVDVYRDRQENGTSFDFVFIEEMIKRYSKK